MNVGPAEEDPRDRKRPVLFRFICYVQSAQLTVTAKIRTT